MNREIKFRAWDKKNKKMIYDDERDIDLFIDFGGTICENECQTFSGTRGYELYLMQYTGLKDKNEKEIYEGDIVDYGFKIPGYTELYKGKVFFGKGMFLVDGDTLNNEFHQLNKCCYLKIIGNIYENKELI